FICLKTSPKIAPMSSPPPSHRTRELSIAMTVVPSIFVPRPFLSLRALRGGPFVTPRWHLRGTARVSSLPQQIAGNCPKQPHHRCELVLRVSNDDQREARRQN